MLTLEAVWYERPASPSLHGPVIIDEGSSATTVSYIACSIQQCLLLKASALSNQPSFVFRLHRQYLVEEDVRPWHGRICYPPARQRANSSVVLLPIDTCL